MPTQIINAFSGTAVAGSQFGWQVDSQGAGLVTGSIAITNTVTISGNIVIGSVSATVDSIFVQSGANISLFQALINSGSVGGVASGVRTSLAFIEIPNGSQFGLTGFDGTGTSDAHFELYHNTTRRIVLRNAVTEKNVIRNFTYPVVLSGGSVVLNVVHGELLNQGFEGNVYGFII